MKKIVKKSGGRYFVNTVMKDPPGSGSISSGHCECAPVNQTAVCGNGRCETSETNNTCPQDCQTQCRMENTCCCNGTGGGDCLCVSGYANGARVCPTGQREYLSSCDDQCKPVTKCRDCSGEGEKVYGSSDFGPTKCCDPDAGIIGPWIKDSSGLCLANSDGSIGVCRSGVKCGDGVCSSVENSCNCPQDCSNASACASEGVVAGHSLNDLPNCCPGLSKISGRAANAAGGCTVSPGGFMVCAKCGDGICGKGEDHCNCQKDCGGSLADCVQEGEMIGGMGENNGKKCCEGLTEVFDQWALDGEGNCRALDNYGYYCLKCGDGTCGKGENKCNCPQDCPEPCLSVGQKGPGGPLATGQSAPGCCAGLNKLKADYDSQCNQAIDGGYVCTRCGDWNCGEGENECNCPQDCGNSVGCSPALNDDLCAKAGGKVLLTSGELHCLCPSAFGCDNLCGTHGLANVTNKDCKVTEGYYAMDNGATECCCQKCDNLCKTAGLKYVNINPNDCKAADGFYPVSSGVMACCCQNPGTDIFCGDDFCSKGETTDNCPQDCSSATPICGNGFCESREDYANCPKDCYTVAPRKPVIYLYPQKPETVNVKIGLAGKMIADYPDYDEASGWKVLAYPDGHLINLADGREYSYLFWEGIGYGNDYDMSQGFVVKGSDTKRFLQDILPKIGLTPKEYNEFIVYWYPHMKDNPYNIIHFAGTEYTSKAKLTITPEPDSVLRVFMVYRPSQTKVEVIPQTFMPFERVEFTVVEWGGSEI